MREIIIDGKELTDREALHEILKNKLGFPEYYGKNLDALFDCLTDISEKTTIVFLDFDAVKENLGGYAEALKKVLKCADAENDALKIKLR